MGKETEQAIQIVANYLVMPRKEILKHIPYQRGSNPTKSLRILLTIYTRPKLTLAGIERLYNTTNTQTASNLSYLVSYGFIEAINKQIFVTGINAWRPVTGYVATPKGKRLIYSLFAQICDEQKEVNYAQAS